MNRSSLLRAMFFCSLIANSECGAAPPQWKPERNVEIIVPSGTGGSFDITARAVQRILHEARLIETTSSAINKPGGGNTIGWLYLNQHPGDGHYLAMSASALLTNQITGMATLTYEQITPLATLYSQYTVFAVTTESPIRTGKDLAERLRNDPDSVSIAIGAAIGAPNHIGAAKVMTASGGDVRKLKAVVFKSTGDSVAAVLGGHVTLLTGSGSALMPQMKAGKLRAIAISSPRRLTGAFAAIPTWREQGVDVVVDNWLGVIGPRNLGPAQVAYWDDVFARLVQTEQWKKELEQNDWTANYMGSREARAFIAAQYAEFKATLGALGLAK
jgi:putative tricarboxylic transport membrane protein